jgi:drug/metabolite transporter (DMT)-like permease
MTEDEEPFTGWAFLVRIRYGLRKKLWAVPLTFAVGGFVLGFLIAPVSTKGNSPDKMTTAFGVLLAAGIALVAAVFVLQRSRFRRLKPVLVFIYAICAVVAPLIGVLPGLPDSFYGHLWGAPLALGLAVAGAIGIFLTFLVGWTQDPSS